MNSPAKTTLSARVRWMLRRDLDRMEAIERACFERPWTGDEFQTCLRQWNCIGSVVEVDEAAWDRIMRVNVTSMMLASKHAIPAMAAEQRDDGGRRLGERRLFLKARPPLADLLVERARRRPARGGVGARGSPWGGKPGRGLRCRQEPGRLGEGGAAKDRDR